jgi:hypothetical protein
MFRPVPAIIRVKIYVEYQKEVYIDVKSSVLGAV